MSTEFLSNILDPVHDGLDPRLFVNPKSAKPKLRPHHTDWIENKVRSTLQKAGYTDDDEWLSLVLTGSLTTYQYSDESDIDISLFVDTKTFPEWSRAEMIGLMVSKLDGTKLPGTPYELQCFVVPHDVTKESLFQPGLRAGYDLDKDTWIVPPDPERTLDAEKEMNGSYVAALESADKMERLLRYEPDKAIQFWHAIHRRRQRDQKAGKGDFSPSNIVYKFLAKRKLFPEIAEVSGEYIASTSASQIMREMGYDFDPDEFAMGMKEEMEHKDVTGGDPYKTAEIAAAHLREDPHYYTKLKKAMG